MRAAIACLLTLSVALVSTPAAQAQAGRYIPVPRLPPGGGGGEHFIPHIPFHVSPGLEGVFWVIGAIVGALFLAFLGWHVGRAAGRWIRPPVEKPEPSWPLGPTVWWAAADPPPVQDLILQPGEVADKAEQTRRLMEFLAHQDQGLNPARLQQWIATTFVLVQKAWEARNYESVRHLLLPNLLSKHQQLLRSMQKNHEINRIKDLGIERLEFVHLHCPKCVGDQEVTALITFRASVYFVDDRTGAYTRGLRSASWFQEFWVFRRRGDGWLLEDIEQSHESSRHERSNFVADLADQQLVNAQASFAL